MPTGSKLAYLDSSALLKLVLSEDESSALRKTLRTWPGRASSRVSIVEVLRGIRLRDATRETLARKVLARVALLACSDRVLMAAASLDPATLRSLDAIHIATALRLGSGLAAFVSYDARQLDIARTLGLPVESPR